MRSDNITEAEQDIYDLLMKQCNEVCPPGPCNPPLFCRIVRMCELMFWIPGFPYKHSPEQVKSLLNSLIAKGYVREYKSNQFPSFVPKEYWLKGQIKIK